MIIKLYKLLNTYFVSDLSEIILDYNSKSDNKFAVKLKCDLMLKYDNLDLSLKSVFKSLLHSNMKIIFKRDLKLYFINGGIKTVSTRDIQSLNDFLAEYYICEYTDVNFVLPDLFKTINDSTTINILCKLQKTYVYIIDLNIGVYKFELSVYLELLEKSTTHGYMNTGRYLEQLCIYKKDKYIEIIPLQQFYVLKLLFNQV